MSYEWAVSSFPFTLDYNYILRGDHERIMEIIIFEADRHICHI